VEDFTDEPCTKELQDLLANGLALVAIEVAKACFTGFDPGLMFSLCSTTSLRIPFMSDGVDGVFWYTKHVHYTLVWICL
jgi:hypothetical protein